jgi:hypothetical protein
MNRLPWKFEELLAGDDFRSELVFLLWRVFLLMAALYFGIFGLTFLGGCK